MMKPLTFTLLFASLTTAAYAGQPGNPITIPTSINLIAPDSTGSWSVGVEGLWAIDNNQNFQYASAIVPGAFVGTTEFGNQAVKGQNDWGIAANINYQFAGNSRDINLQYTGVFMNNSDSFTSESIILGPPGIGLTAANKAHASSKQTSNRVDLTFGQSVSVGEDINLHPFAGISFANLDVKNKANYTLDFDDEEEPLPFAAFKATSRFWGIGPSIGADASIYLADGFSLIGRVGAALFVGEMTSHITTRTSEFDFLDTTVNYTKEPMVTVVPELDARLGLGYQYAFNPTTSLNIQAGYEVANYFNAISDDTVDAGSIEANNINAVNNLTNFNYYGPYLRLQLNLA